MAISDLPEKTTAISSSLGNSDLLTIIGVIIALAAYIASVRGRILDKAVAASIEIKKTELKNYAKRLMFADVPLIISGLMLIIYTALKTFANTEIGILLNLGMSLFAIALAVLAIFHALEWYKSFNA